MAKQKDDNEVVFLKSKRLHMRPPTKEDIPCFLRWMNDPEVTYFLSAFLPVTETDEIEWLERLQKEREKQIVLVMVDRKSKKPIGVMGVHKINWKDRTATTGAAIGEKKFWGKGYGTEAKMVLLNYAFNMLNLRKIYSNALSFNQRSLAYSKKCGYTVEGIYKKDFFKHDCYWDIITLSVFRKDWRPKWKKFCKTGKA